MHIIIIGGISRSLINFRGPLIRSILDQGHKVTACAGEPLPEVATTLEKWGVQFISIPLARAGMNPIGDLKTFFSLRCIMRQIHPDLVLAYTIKPVIWGGLAAHSAGIHNMYALITGLGYAFIGGTSPKQRLAGWLARWLYKTSLKHCHKVFFQNPDDAREFIQRKLVDAGKTVVVSGSGVDLSHFGKIKDSSCSGSLPANDTNHTNTLGLNSCHSRDSRATNAPSFLLIARLLRDKGICEYAEAAAIVKRDYPDAEFHLIGDYDPNPSGLSPADINAWVNAGTIIYHGQQPDVRPFLRDCDVYVLPSYREGTPRTVLEAMATGRPIITTDAPGCRETVRFENEDCFCSGNLPANNTNDTNSQEKYSCDSCHSRATNILQFGTNGILIPPRNATALAKAMRYFIDNPAQITDMGHESRLYAEDRYDVHKVNAVMLREMYLLVNERQHEQPNALHGSMARE